MSTSATEESSVTQEVRRVVKRRQPYLWVIYGLLAVLVLAAAYSAAVNQRFGWGVVATYFLSSAILKGLLTTLELTVLSMLLGIVLGVLLAMMRVSRGQILPTVAQVYVWFFRGTPLLVQILFWFNLAALYPRLGLGIPGGGSLFSLETNALISPFVAAILALSLHEAAYMAEIVRSGVIGVDRGQRQAALALGMRPSRIMRRIVLPQAMRTIIPPTGNQTISMLKTSSLVSVIALNDLLYTAQSIYGINYQVIPLLVVASLWYLIVVSVLSVGQSFVERRYGRGMS
jgi:polar amino acid transport system permease protein